MPPTRPILTVLSRTMRRSTTLFADLPEGSRRVLELRYREGLEIDEIAERLDMTRNAVDQALHRGHSRLRERIGAS